MINAYLLFNYALSIECVANTPYLVCIITKLRCVHMCSVSKCTLYIVQYNISRFYLYTYTHTYPASSWMLNPALIYDCSNGQYVLPLNLRHPLSFGTCLQSLSPSPLLGKPHVNNFAFTPINGVSCVLNAWIKLIFWVMYNFLHW